MAAVARLPGPAPRRGTLPRSTLQSSPVQSPPNWESCQRFLGTGCAERGQIPAQADTRHNARGRAAPTATGLASSSSSLHQQQQAAGAAAGAAVYEAALAPLSFLLFLSFPPLRSAAAAAAHRSSRVDFALSLSVLFTAVCAPLAIPAPLSLSPTSPFRPILLLSPLLLPRTRFPIPPPPFPPPFHAASARPGSAHRGVAAFFVGGRADFVCGLIGSGGGSGKLRVVGIGA